MGINAAQQGEERKEGQEQASKDEGETEDLNAFVKGKCHICHKKRHFASQCPKRQQKGAPGKGGKGKGKGKGEDKGKGKGKAAAPLDGSGCWNCGGQHFSADCPKAAGKRRRSGRKSICTQRAD